MKVRNKKGRKHRNSTELVVRIDSKDCWSLDHTLAQIIVPALELLKEEKHGAPSDMPSFIAEWNLTDDEKALDPNLAADLNRQGFQEWDEALDEMIWAFTQIRDNDYLLDHSVDEAKAHYAKIQKGLHVFAEYYQGLWD